MSWQPTRYEIALINTETGERILLAYSIRKSRVNLAAVVADRPEMIVRATGCTEYQYASRKGADGLILDNGPWFVRYTGRTRRDARQAGELVFADDIRHAGELEALTP